MHLKNTPPANGDELEAAIGWFMAELVRGESLVLQKSSVLSLVDNLPDSTHRRRALEAETANYLLRLYHLGHGHNLDPIRRLNKVDFELVRRALAAFSPQEGAA